MRTRSILSRTLFGTAVAAALGFGVSSANAAAAPPVRVDNCPAYTATAQECNECCERVYGGFGAWSPSTKRCMCGF